MKLRLLFLTALILIPFSNALIFNEVMYNPMGSDDNSEWIEIYNDENETINIENWKLYEAETNHNINLMMGSYFLEKDEYALVAENPQNFLLQDPNFQGTLFDSTFSLSNSGETISLKNKTGHTKDTLSYTSLLGGNENGFTQGLYGGQWIETLPTPGKENDVSDICDWKVSIFSDLIFEDDFDWKIKVEKLIGDKGFITIKREIEDSYGKTVKSYSDLTHEITNYETLSYSPNLNAGIYLLKTEILPYCNDTNKENNVAERLIVVQEDRADDSSLEIQKIYDLGSDKIANFGQLIRINILAYKGDTEKSTISLWIEKDEKVSKVLTFKLENNYEKQELTVPVQIFPNCNNQFKSGFYDVVLEGLGEKDIQKIEISNSTKLVCEKEVVEKIVEKLIQPKENPKQNSPREYAVSATVYESAQRKSEKLVPYFIAFIMSAALVFAIFSSKAF